MSRFHCQHCDKPFDVADGDSLRCPTCLRTSGLSAAGGPTAGGRSPMIPVAAGLVVLVAAGAGAWWFFGKKDSVEATPSAPAPGRTVVDSPSVGASPAVSGTGATAPASPVAPTAEGAVAAFAKAAIGATAPEKLAALAKALTAKVTPMPVDRLLGRDVLRPAALAGALEKATAESKLAVTGVEAGAFLLAAAQAAGLSAAPSVIVPAGGGRCVLRLVRLGVQLAEGATAIDPLTGLESAATTVSKDAPESYLLGLESMRKVEEHALDAAAELVSKAMIPLADDPALKMLHGQLATLRGAPDAGFEEMAAAVTVGADAASHFQLGVAYLQGEKQFKAFEAFKRATELDPKYAEGWAALGQVTLDRLETADEAQKAAVNAELDGIEKALLAIAADAPGLFELRIERLALGGKVDEAVSEAKALVEKHPTRASLLTLLASLLEKKGDSDGAAAALEKAATLEGADALPLLKLAQMRAEAGKIDEAIAALEKARVKAPHDPGILMQLAGAYQHAEKSDKAIEVATELEKRFPEVMEGTAMLAQLLVAKGETAKATETLERGLKRDPKSIPLYIILYMVHDRANETAKADEVMKRLLVVDRDGRMHVAGQLLKAQALDKALALMEAELKEHPERIEVSIALSQIYRSLDKKDDVERIRKAAIERAADKDAAKKRIDEALAEVDTQRAKSAEAPAPEAPAPEAPAAP